MLKSILTSSQRVIVATSYAMLLAAVLVDTEHLVIDGRQILSLFANQSPMDFDVQFPSVIMSLDAVEDTLDTLACVERFRNSIQ